MTVWISKTLALAIHDRQLAEHGGSPDIRDETLLESALARPQQAHTCSDPPPNLANLAASLAYGLARNHPFADGNKRTAHVFYRVFLALNNADLIASEEEKYVNMIALAEGSMNEAGFAAWLRERLHIDADSSINEADATYAPR